VFDSSLRHQKSQKPAIQKIAGFCIWRPEKLAALHASPFPAPYVRSGTLLAALPQALEPRRRRQLVDHCAELDQRGGLHSHLPGPGGGLHRGHHRTRFDRARRARSDRANSTGPLRQDLARLQDASQGQPKKRHCRSRPHHQEHLPHAHDARHERVLRLLQRRRDRGLLSRPALTRCACCCCGLQAMKDQRRASSNARRLMVSFRLVADPSR
jgi:hypothetical protein